MADKKCKKGSRSGAHGDARKAVTRRNKERKLKRYNKWVEKRKEKKAEELLKVLKGIKVVHKKARPGTNIQGHDVDPSIHLIQFRAEDGKRSLHEVRIEGSTPEGFTTTKDDPAMIHFMTKGGKRWSMRLSEFSFVILPKKINVVQLLKAAADAHVGEPVTVEANG